MLKQDVIQPSNSPWSSPVVLVRKKDGSWRFCVDYRKVNAVTIKTPTHYQGLTPHWIPSQVQTVFATLDLASGYWQVELEDSAKGKTAFSTHRGHFEFNVMPFGLTNAPATLQRLLAGLTPNECLIYLDDIIVFGKSFEEHLHRLKEVLKCFRGAGLKLNANSQRRR